MIIKADNRGRLALGKAAGGSIYDMSHTEWDVKYEDGGFTIQPHPKPKDTKLKWRYHTFLTPEMIGQVVRILGVYHGWDVANEEMPLPRVKDYQPEIVGVLEAYSLVEGREWVKIQGYPGLINLDSRSNLGNEYGTAIYFGIQA